MCVCVCVCVLPLSLPLSLPPSPSLSLCLSLSLSLSKLKLKSPERQGCLAKLLSTTYVTYVTCVMLHILYILGARQGCLATTPSRKTHGHRKRNRNRNGPLAGLPRQAAIDGRHRRLSAAADARHACGKAKRALYTL